ncbi:TlpA disulfide reductase family protein, partial [Desulfobaculum sp.]
MAVLFTLFSPVCVNAGYLGGVDAKALQDIVDDSTGRVVVLSFWATWCPPCVREMPDFLTLRRSVSDDEMRLIGISLDFDEDTLKTYVDENKVNFPIYRATPGLAKHFEVEGVPKLMVWDAQGTL